MRLFRLSYSLLASNWILNIFVGLQLCAVMLFGNYYIAIKNSALRYYDQSNGFTDNNYYYCYQDDYGTSSAFDLTQTTLYTYADQGLLSYSVPLQKSARTSGNDKLDLIGYDTFLASTLFPDGGQMFIRNSEQQGIIRCLLSSSAPYSIGDTIAIDYISTVNIDDNGYPQPVYQHSRLLVCGYLPSNTAVLSLSGSASGFMDIDQLFVASYAFADDIYTKIRQKNSDRPIVHSQSPYVLCPLEDMIAAGFSCNVSKNYILTLSDRLSASDKQELIEQLKKEAYVYSIEEMRMQSKENARAIMLRYLPMLIAFAILAVLGLTCIVLLGVLRCKSIWRIYWQCGMSRNEALGIVVGFQFLLFAFTAVLFTVVWFGSLWSGIMPSNSMLVNGNNVYFSVFGLLGMFGVSTGIQYALVEKLFARGR